MLARALLALFPTAVLNCQGKSSLKRPNKAASNGQSLMDRMLTGKVDDITEGMENGLI